MAKVKKDENVEGVNDQANAGDDALETVSVATQDVGNVEDVLGFESEKPDEPMDATVVPEEPVEIPDSADWHPFDAIAGPDQAKLQMKVKGIMGFEHTGRCREAIRCLAKSEWGKFGDLIGSTKNTNQQVRQLLNNAMARAEKPKVDKG